MRRFRRRTIAAFIVAAAVLCSASAGFGRPAAVQCFGLDATIVGTEGPDQLVGTPGDDVIVGLGGDDVILGGPGNDVLCGGAGNDSFVPGPGNDRLDGGGGGQGVGFLDLVTYAPAPNGVRVDLLAGTATGEGTDTLRSITEVAGSPYDDVLSGNADVNFFFPGAGNDVVDGRGGDDDVGFDAGVVASLVTGTATGEGTDRLVSIEGLLGSKFADTLTGDGRDNYLAGGPGNDTLNGAGGNDAVYGDEANDRVLGGSGEDHVSGDEGNDNVRGGSNGDTLSGGAGNDTLTGGGGEDVISYLRVAHGIQANLVVGRVAGDGLDSVSAVEDVDGSELSDQILGTAKTNFLSGNAGVDRVAAGAGADFLDGGGGGGALIAGSGRDYCLQQSGAQGCEIVGLPASLPPLTDQPPAWRWAEGPAPGVSLVGRRMHLPGRYLAVGRQVTALRKRALLVHDPSDHADGPHGLLPAGAAPPGTGSFRYLGQPSCYAGSKPYRTTVAPPDQVQPAVVGSQTERVFWRAVLFRQAGSKLVREDETPWATAVVQGPGIPTGFPKWTSYDQTSFVSSFTFRVPAGTYSWAAKIKWQRSGAERKGFIEPHIVHTAKVRPDKSCKFGSSR